MSEPNAKVARLYELLADQAGGELLESDERSELARLGTEFPSVDPESFEQAAAVLHLAWISPTLEPMPTHLRDRLMEDARGVLPGDPLGTDLSDSSGAGAAEDTTSPTGPTHPSPPSPPGPRSTAPAPAGPSAWLGWVAAAAAIILWMVQPRVEAPRTTSLSEVRAAADVVIANWSPTEDPGGSGVTGEVVWSDTLQAGYMSFEGLAPNDPNAGQYQLWIFDADHPSETPVDGGVFDAQTDAQGQLLIEIDAKLAIAEPALFAITYERPGGVVVSSRERLLLTGSPQ